MKTLIRILFFSLFFILQAHANDKITITENMNALYDFTLQEFHDKEGTYKVEELDQYPSQKSSNHLSKGYSDDVFWYRFNLHNATKNPLTYYLHFSENFIHKVDFYLYDNKTYFHETQGISTLSKTHSEVLNPTFKIELQPNEEKKVTLRIESQYPIFTDIFLFDKEAMLSFDYEYDQFYTFFLAGILALLLYNISIFFFTKDISYLYYVLYGSCFLIWQSVQIGLEPFNQVSSSDAFYNYSLSIPLMLAAMVLFTRSLLDVQKHFPIINRILLTCAYVYLGLAVIGIFNFLLSITIVNGLAFFVLPFLFYVGIISCLRKNKIARFYIIAQFSFISLSTLFALAAFGLLDFSNFTRHGIVVGAFIEMILFSFALAYRIRLLEKEKIELIKKTNEELEQKVKERTKELEDSKDHLKRLANHDPLTSLYNRRCLFDVSKKLLGLAKREQKPLSLIMFDLDNFKTINDRYGHSVGDSVIINFSWCLKNLRASDVVARIGGEEFVAILPNTSKEDAFHIAEGIRKQCSKIRINIQPAKTIKVTVSGGVASLQHDNDTKLEDLIFRADKRLYDAKRAGRNRIVAND